MQRRDFLKVTGMTIATTSGLGTASLAVAEAAAAPAPAAAIEPGIRTGPYLQDPTADGITIMWLTTVPGYGIIEHGPTEALGQKTQAYVDGLIQANNVLHRIRLAGPTPNTPYYYRINFRPTPVFLSHKVELGEPIYSPIHRFTTRDPAAKSVRFVMYNDVHDNLAMWRRLHALIAGEKIDFALLNGDITNQMRDEKQLVEHFLDMCSGMFATETPFIYARGNHEVRGAFARQMKQYLTLPGGGSGSGEFHYAFTCGPARFVVLDSGEDKADSDVEYSGMAAFDDYRSMQREFLKQEIQSDAWKSARWRIAIFHIPGYYSNGWHGPQEVKAKWHPLLNEGKADLFLAGHTHHYTVAKADPAMGHNYPIIIGGGPKDGLGTVTLVDVDEKNIRIKMMRDDGVQVGEMVV